MWQPPFSMCLAIATACVSTCSTGAVEVIPKRQFLRGQGARCVNGSIPSDVIEQSAIEGNGVGGAYLAFLYARRNSNPGLCARL